MDKNLLFTLVVLFSLLIVDNCFAQDRIVQGQVFTFDSIPLVNAQIKVKSSKQIVKTDSLGRFSLACNETDVFNVSATGFTTRKFKLKKDTKEVHINLALKQGEKNKELAFTSGHINEYDKISIEDNLNKPGFDFSQYTSMYEVIKNRFPGVQIYNGEIIIGGMHSLTGSSAALIVVDGVPSDHTILNSVSPTQVKSVKILRNVSAAIYGSRGANGVVIIETKKEAEKD